MLTTKALYAGNANAQGVAELPGCWRTFGEVQADEVQRFGYTPAHRVVVEAYMAQHSGDGSDRRNRQSVFVHLVGRRAVLEHGLPHPCATQLLGRFIRRQPARRVSEPAAPRGPGPAQRLLDMVGATGFTDYERRAREWAGAVWDSWSDQHELIRAELDAVLDITRS